MVVSLVACACSSRSTNDEQGMSALVSEADIASADSTVRAFLTAARTGEYAAAMASFDGEWRRTATNWFEGGDTLTAVEFLREGCKGLLRCDLDVRTTASSKLIPPDTIELFLELTDRDGRRFEPPPCCGSTENADTLFAFSVVKRPEGLRVVTLPVYRP